MLRILFAAISAIESGGNPRAHNVKEDAVGIVQIRRCVIDDVNRFSKHHYSYEDRADVYKSFAIFNEYLDHYANDKMPRDMARVWNGGPKGCEKKATEKYAERVMRIYGRLEHAK